ncbi:MAG: alpha-ketoacid dehydrogenase subunit alpha/beta [Saccharofermentanales bacterium]|jgi:2-oxoisovalerate dehydrogenase E1 component
MPKSQIIRPEHVRCSGTLPLKDIPLNTYQKRLPEVKSEFPAADLVSLFDDMRLIREFETMLAGIRTVKVYNGIEYSYTGPAHLSIGQEASAVGQAYALDINDFTFGTHRSHGEVLARAFSAIRRLDEETLYQIMADFRGGALLRNVEAFSPHKDNIRELAMDYFLYGFMTELFGREIGFTGGLGNSMHVFFTPFGIYPNNAIVGAAGIIANGAALYKKLQKKPGIIVVNSGDGSLSTGAAWESFNFAAMGQYRELWADEYKGGLPIIFNYMNNFYAMSGQTYGETMGYEALVRVGAAINPEQMHAERIDGYNVFAVIDAFRRKKELILKNQGPVLIDTLTYRHTGHSVTDQNAYRTKEEMDCWYAEDSIATLQADLAAEGLQSDAEAQAKEESFKERITRILIEAIDLKRSPRMDLEKEPDAIARYMYSNEYNRTLGEGTPEVIGEKSENSRLKRISKKSRTGLDENGNPLPAIKVVSYRDAIYEALLDKFYEDPTMILFGEDVREHGNSFGVLQGLYESVPRHRLFNAPIAESSIISAGVGYAMCGGRAVPEIMWGDFLGRCADELFNQLAKWQGMSAGLLKMPCTVRISIGAFYGAQHSQDWTSLCAHVPGLKIVYPASPYDAKGLLNSALCSSDPVIYFESQKLYDMGEQFHQGGVPAEYYEVPLGVADIKRPGKDITFLTLGPTLIPALAAAKTLSEKYNLEAEVIDARTLVPFDYETVLESVRKTNRIIILSDGAERGNYIKTIASNITELAFDHLDAPPVTLGAHNWVSPSPELEKFFFPQENWILDAIDARIVKLPGHVATTRATNDEKLRIEKLGI